MRNKTKRLLTIRKLIESELISSQEELLFRLKEMNVEATQSTLSRDLKFMKVAKIPHKEKGYIYVIPESIQNEQREEKVSAIITDTILSIDFSGNMAVIKTLPGYANAVTVLGEGVFDMRFERCFVGLADHVSPFTPAFSRSQHLPQATSVVLPASQFQTGLM